jgi:hypothetical protein
MPPGSTTSPYRVPEGLRLQKALPGFPGSFSAIFDPDYEREHGNVTKA